MKSNARFLFIVRATPKESKLIVTSACQTRLTLRNAATLNTDIILCTIYLFICISIICILYCIWTGAVFERLSFYVFAHDRGSRSDLSHWNFILTFLYYFNRILYILYFSIFYITLVEFYIFIYFLYILYFNFILVFLHYFNRILYFYIIFIYFIF